MILSEPEYSEPAMTKDEIRAEFYAFIEFPDGSDGRYVTTTSALLFAQHIAEKAASKRDTSRPRRPTLMTCTGAFTPCQSR